MKEFWLDYRVRLIERKEERDARKAKQNSKRFRIDRRLKEEKEKKHDYYINSK